MRWLLPRICLLCGRRFEKPQQYTSTYYERIAGMATKDGPGWRFYCRDKTGCATRAAARRATWTSTSEA